MKKDWEISSNYPIAKQLVKGRDDWPQRPHSCIFLTPATPASQETAHKTQRKAGQTSNAGQNSLGVRLRRATNCPSQAGKFLLAELFETQSWSKDESGGYIKSQQGCFGIVLEMLVKTPVFHIIVP